MLTARNAHRAGTFLAIFLLPLILGGSASQAGVIVGLLLNPNSTAGVATSNRSGSGSWQLYAIEDAAANDFGISSYSITMTGTTRINHRSPNGLETDSNGDPQTWGFANSRSGTNVNPIVASEPFPTADPIAPPLITGFGRTANTASAAILAIDPGATGITVTSGASWGNYNSPALTPLATSTDHKWVFLAEGLGSNVAVAAASFAVYSNTSGASVATPTQIQTLDDGFPLLTIDNVNANDPGVVSQDLNSIYTGPPPNQFSFIGLGYTSPAGVESYPTWAHPATIDPITKVFRWDTTRAMLGEYYWHTAYLDSNGAWNPHLDIKVRITAVPEPATFAMVGVAMIGGFGFMGRRRSISRRES